MSITLPFIVSVSPTLKVRGLIATKTLRKGQIVEKCPVILVDISQQAALKKTVLWKYYFEWNASHHCIVLGYGSLMNHSYSPNVRYLFDKKNHTIQFIAIKTIKKGEELMINYNYFPNSKTKLNSELLDYNIHMA